MSMLKNYTVPILTKQHVLYYLYVLITSFSTSVFAQNTDTNSENKQSASQDIATGTTTYNPFKVLTYTQHTTVRNNYALGQYSIFSNAFTAEPLPNLKITVEGGPALQQSFFSPLPPNLHLYYRAELSYAITDYIQPYIYNQHLSKPLGDNPDNLRLNPFFLQSEFGTGIKTEMKTYLLETGVKTMTNPIIGQQSMQTQVFSKLSKSF
ncbi:hypothetical protein BKP44_01955 [Formosa algae]|nr:hypothetical protein BKP44_01955 [Formosa algae]